MVFYFQGYFFFRPDIIRGREIPANRIALLELLGKIQDPHIPFKGLVEHIRNDLSLSYKILRYLNSAYVGLPNRVDSIAQACPEVQGTLGEHDPAFGKCVEGGPPLRSAGSLEPEAGPPHGDLCIAFSDGPAHTMMILLHIAIRLAGN